MPRNRMTNRDVAALAGLVDRYGSKIIIQQAEALHSAKRKRGRPRDANWLPRAFIRWSLVQDEMQTKQLRASPAAEAVRGRTSPSTLRKAYAKFERLRQAHPELRQRSDALLGLYRPEIIDALEDEDLSEDGWLGLCWKYAPK